MQGTRKRVFMRDLQAYTTPATTDRTLVMRLGQRFESARRLSLIGVDKLISLRKAVHFSVTLSGMPRDGSHTAAMAPEINAHEHSCQTSCSRTALPCRIM